ncbi:hypothetical protein PG1C_00740 [Rugosibacter aromaticivorans]|uniref:Uncharacterized protein n=1 Tax=Rugosibacter aromaticivorans TaxID=1565605 RepID=A0A0C5J6U4_9PROT|nr:hypothetical protein PG1C_00740 [Rugosibacter aromaticivorans]
MGVGTMVHSRLAHRTDKGLFQLSSMQAIADSGDSSCEKIRGLAQIHRKASIDLQGVLTVAAPESACFHQDMARLCWGKFWLTA